MRSEDGYTIDTARRGLRSMMRRNKAEDGIRTTCSLGSSAAEVGHVSFREERICSLFRTSGGAEGSWTADKPRSQPGRHVYRPDGRSALLSTALSCRLLTVCSSRFPERSSATTAVGLARSRSPTSTHATSAPARESSFSDIRCSLACSPMSKWRKSPAHVSDQDHC